VMRVYSLPPDGNYTFSSQHGQLNYANPVLRMPTSPNRLSAGTVTAAHATG
jgi:hypothetical protein